MASNNIFFTSDLHFLHDNIVKYCNRPTTIEEHTEWLIETVNKDLNDTSQVYHIGDFTGKYKNKYSDIEYIISQLKGTWHFIKGNHDNEKQLQNILKGTRHKWLGDYHELKHNNRSIILFHYPIETWNKKHYGSIHLHGHSHSRNSNIVEYRHDIGIDVDYRLFSINEVMGPGFRMIDYLAARNQYMYYVKENKSDSVIFAEYLYAKHGIDVNKRLSA